jgi:hypothetical protein
MQKEGSAFAGARKLLTIRPVKDAATVDVKALDFAIKNARKPNVTKATIALEDVGDGVSLTFTTDGKPLSDKTQRERTPAEHVATHALLAIRRMLSQLAGDDGTVLQQAELEAGSKQRAQA